MNIETIQLIKSEVRTYEGAVLAIASLLEYIEYADNLIESLKKEREECAV